jgi:glycosyltransferase involved in cell wall biosynthesis
MSQVLPISLCTFVRNEEENIRDCIESVRPIVAEVVIVDTGSTDRTIKICREFTDRIYKVGFSDFGSIRTITAHLSLYPWVLMLDADERILSEDWGKFIELINQPWGTEGDNMELDKDGNVVIDSWALPRKRWADLWMRQQVEPEAYPDWQVRLFRNYIDRPRIKFVRRVHETITGCIKTAYAEDGPTIHHFQNVHKTNEDLKVRQNLYEELRAKDIAEGTKHTSPAVVEMDRVDESDGNS